MSDYQTPFILTPMGRYLDLMKQGFMKPLPKPRIRKDGKPYGTPKPVEIVACHGCQNWHPKGQHIERNIAKRRANEKRHRDADKRYEAIRRGEMAL